MALVELDEGDEGDVFVTLIELDVFVACCGACEWNETGDTPLVPLNETGDTPLVLLNETGDTPLVPLEGVS